MRLPMAVVAACGFSLAAPAALAEDLSLKRYLENDQPGVRASGRLAPLGQRWNEHGRSLEARQALGPRLLDQTPMPDRDSGRGLNYLDIEDEDLDGLSGFNGNLDIEQFGYR